MCKSLLFEKFREDSDSCIGIRINLIVKSKGINFYYESIPGIFLKQFLPKFIRMNILLKPLLIRNPMISLIEVKFNVIIARTNVNKRGIELRFFF